MAAHIHRPLLVAGMLLSFTLGGIPARAQIALDPQALNVSVPQHETELRTVVLTNTGNETGSFCLSFDRPLQRVEGTARLAPDAAGVDTPCGTYGEIIYQYDEDDFEDDIGGGANPYTITMAPGERLFIAESGGGVSRTFEFTPELEFVRFFEYPVVAELTPFAATRGITYDTESGTLWWINLERRNVSGQDITYRVLLLEGNLDGKATGRRIEIVPPDSPLEAFEPGGLSYSAATDLFYFTGQEGEPETRRLWAVDRTGTLVEGYPLRPEPYPPPALIGSPDAHGGAEGDVDGVRVEYGAYPPGALGFDRVAVVDHWGNDEGEVLETPVPDALFEGWGAGIRGNPLRSRIDPNGVMYMTFTNFDNEGIVGVRPHPLPPSWLVVDSDAGPEAAWDGVLAPGESREIMLTFRAGARAVGEYTASLQAFEAATGEAVEVPLVLSVTKGTDAEDEGAAPEASALAVYPNPTTSSATVALTLEASAEVEVAVFDVLGRRVALVREGLLEAGTHHLHLDSSGLPAGVYLLRLESGDRRLSERITVLR